MKKKANEEVKAKKNNKERASKEAGRRLEEMAENAGQGRRHAKDVATEQECAICRVG